MSGTRKIPDSDAELAVWGDNFTAQITQNAAAWEIEREGGKGPYSAIEKAVIP
ncbi:MAG: hypothetical protein LBS48_01525 [Treponema sp.]|jgi:hypothetical protein|nr:hypothetical protein [Treponema sp.]